MSVRRAAFALVRNWPASAAPAANDELQERWRCAWTSAGERCSYPATMTATTHADESTPWYCAGHWQALQGDQVIGEEALRRSRSHRGGPRTFAELLEARAGLPAPREAGAIPLGWRCSVTAVAVQAVRFDVARREHEPFDAWADRIEAAMCAKER